MKIVVLGASGMIGSRLVRRLRALGATAVVASPTWGVDAVTGEGLQQAFAGADVVVDVTNAADYDPDRALAFFDAAGRNVLEAGMGAGVRHHLALSIVGADRLPDSGYFRAKRRQEQLIQSAALPYTIVRSTQFYEFAPRIVEAAGGGSALRLSPAPVQPIAADDVAEILARAALDAPRRIVEIAGPRRLGLDAFIRDYLALTEDGRAVVTDRAARYFGTWINDEALAPDEPFALGTLEFPDWLRRRIAETGAAL